MTTFIFANNAKSTLASGISSTATTVVLATGSGSLFPSPTSGQQFTLTFTDSATGLVNEICYCTARSSDTLTIVRGQEGTTARAWLAGDIASNKITAGTATSFAQGGSGGTATNIANGAANQVVYQTAANTTGFITAPTTASTYLQWTGTSFAWSNSTSSGPTLTSNNAWTGNNTFTNIAPSSAGGASLGSSSSYWNTTFSTIFQCVTPGSIPTTGAVFFEQIYGGSNYGWVGGNYGQILGYGGLGGSPNYVNVAIADANGLYPASSGTALGTSGLPWGTVTATNGTFSGNVSGTWTGNTVAVSKGGTGTNTTPSNGQLLIGNGSGYSLGTLTAGSNVTITNSSGSITISASGSGSGPSLSSNNAWTGSNTFTTIGPSSAGGASLGSSSSYWNTTYSTVFQCVTPGGSPTTGAVFFEEIYNGSNYGWVGGTAGQILGYGGSGSYTNVVIADASGFYPASSGISLGISGFPWGTINAVNGSFSGNVSGTWNGGTISTTKGGTGLSTTPSNGQLLIGNGSGYSLGTLTAGSNVTITNSSGSITISASGSGGIATNLAGGAANQIPYQTAANTTSFIAAPTTASTYLQWTGSGFTWASTTTGGPTLTSNNAWTGTNTFTTIGPSSAGGASLGSSSSYWNTVYSTVFQCVTPGGSPTTGAVFFEEIYYGSNYGWVGGTVGQILGYGNSGSYTNIAIADATGFYPASSGTALGTSGLPWGTVTATNGTFSGNVSGTWNGNTVAVSKGGTGLNTTPLNGQLLIGNGSGYSLSNLIQGSGIAITNSSGNITIAQSGTVSSAFNIAGGAANQIAYQTAANTTSFIAAPTTASTYLQWTGSGFTWASAASGGPTLSSNNAWTGTNTFTTIGPSSAGGASLGSSSSYWNTTYSTVFQCVTPGGSPTTGAVFFEEIYNGSNYGWIGGTVGQILGYGNVGSYTNVAIADNTGFYPASSGTALGTSSLPWGTVTATTGSFSGNVSGTWNGSTISTAKGGTGVNTTPSNGQLLIGNGSGYSLNTLTAGSNVTITNTSGNITISASSTGGIATNIAGGAANEIAYQTAANTTNFIAAPTTASTYLQWTGSGFAWASTSGPTLSSNNAWTGTNTFLTINPATASGASLGSTSLYWNTVYSTVFQCVTPGGSPTTGAVFFEEIYYGSNYGWVGGTVGQILGYGSSGSYTNVALADATGFYPASSGTALGTSSLPWGTVTATTGSFSGNVSGTWNGSTISTSKGGTGLSTTPSNGQLLIGNGSGYALGTLTAGSGISITNGSGSVTVANSGVTSISATSPLAVSSSTGSVSLSISNVPLLNATNAYSGYNNFGSGSTGYVPPTGAYIGTIYSNATNTNGSALITTAYNSGQYNWSAVVQSSSEYIAYFSQGSSGGSLTGIGSITYNGTGTTYGTSSDRRLKDNIASLPAGTGLAKIAEMQPRSFTWKQNGTEDMGFIADELQAVVPAAVSGSPTDVHEDGSIKPQAIDTSFLVVYLVQAIQELAAEVAALKGKA